MNIRRLAARAALSTLAVASVGQAVASEASAAMSPWYAAGDAYGQRVTINGQSMYSSVAYNNQLSWDTAGANVEIAGQVKDTGRGDGQYAGLYARFYFTDGTTSPLKLIGETGNETSFVPVSRFFTPSKRVKGVQLLACRRSSTGVNACGTPTPSATLIWDNPYT